MFVVQYFVGSRFGGWVRGFERFPSHQAAQAEADRRSTAEMSRDLVPFTRRVVAA